MKMRFTAVIGVLGALGLAGCDVPEEASSPMAIEPSFVHGGFETAQPPSRPAGS
jgi:hypothetical protein